MVPRLRDDDGLDAVAGAQRDAHGFVAVAGGGAELKYWLDQDNGPD